MECSSHFNRKLNDVSFTCVDPNIQLNSSTADLYALPRFAVLQGHEHKACMSLIIFHNLTYSLMIDLFF